MKNEAKNEIQKLISLKVKEHGLVCLGVFDDGEDQNHPWDFIYTVGNHLKNLPDLLFVGEAGNRGHSLLMLLMGVVNDRNEPLKNNEIVSLGGVHGVKIIDADSFDAKSHYTVQATAFYGNQNYKVQQVLCPDQSGKYPDDPDCDPQFKVPLLKAQ